MATIPQYFLVLNVWQQSDQVGHGQSPWVQSYADSELASLYREWQEPGHRLLNLRWLFSQCPVFHEFLMSKHEGKVIHSNDKAVIADLHDFGQRWLWNEWYFTKSWWGARPLAAAIVMINYAMSSYIILVKWWKWINGAAPNAWGLILQYLVVQEVLMSKQAWRQSDILRWQCSHRRSQRSWLNAHF